MSLLKSKLPIVVPEVFYESFDAQGQLKEAETEQTPESKVKPLWKCGTPDCPHPSRCQKESNCDY